MNNFINKILYFLYYLKETDYKELTRYINHISKTHRISRVNLVSDVISSSFKYNISLVDYFYFRFYNIKKNKRRGFAGTGWMYEYQKAKNPSPHREILSDKKLFYKKYSPLIKRKIFTIEEIKNNPALIKRELKNSKVVAKNSRGQGGRNIYIFHTAEGNVPEMMKQYNADILEEYIHQHPTMQKLSPSGLNTVRIITEIPEDTNVKILAARLRISVNSHVDNLAAGNLAAPVSIASGKVTGPAVYSDIEKDPVTVHPVTRVPIEGFVVPYWDEVIGLSQKAALHYPDNRSVGWDIAITPEGPELIEGNHNWCKLLWQLPVRKGLKNDLIYD